MKKNTGLRKKRPRRRHKKKQLKRRQRSLRQRLARLEKIRQALAAIRPASRSPVVEPDPEKPLPTPTRGKPFWDVTMNSVDAPRCFGMPRLQLPPKILDRVTVRLPRPDTPLTVNNAMYHYPAVLRPSTWVLLLLSDKPCDPPPEAPHSAPPPLPHPLESAMHKSHTSLTTGITVASPPALPSSSTTPHRVEPLKDLTLAVSANHASSEEQDPANNSEKQAPANNDEDHVPHEVILGRYQRNPKFKLTQTNKPFWRKIISQLQSAEEVFDENAAKHYFRTHYCGLTKTTFGPEWEHSDAERVFVELCEISSKLKQECLEEFECVPKEFFCALEVGIAPLYGPPGLTRQADMISVILLDFYEDLAEFDQLIQNVLTSSLTEPGAPESPADPLGEAVMTRLIASYKHHFRKHYGLTKTTSGLKQEFLEEFLEKFEGMPKGIFCAVDEVALGELLGLTRQDYMMLDILLDHYEKLADVDQLTQNMVVSSPTEPGAPESPADPLGEAVITRLIASYPGHDTPFNNDNRF